MTQSDPNPTPLENAMFKDDFDTLEPNRLHTRGRHKIYVGAAAGVGKTYRALQDIRELLSSGRDALVGVVETHGRADTLAQLEGLPVFPRLQHEYKGVNLSEMDLDGLLERRPQWVLVDELAHTNVQGSRNTKRYQDVENLLEGGINVISTMNVQHLESLNDIIARLTSVRVRERVPDDILEDADEVLLVDITPEILRERLKNGKIYARDKVDQALENFFKLENLSVLREIALRQVADTVEAEGDRAHIKERVLVCITANPSSGRLIRRGSRTANRLKGDLEVLFIDTGVRLSRDEDRILDGYKTITESLGGTFIRLEHRGRIGDAIVDFTRKHRINLVVLGETRRSRWEEFLRGSIISRVLRELHGVDVYVITRE